MRAVKVSEVGGPEVLRVCDVPEPQPREGEVLIDVALAGVNFGDTHQREGQYIAERELPFCLLYTSPSPRDRS